jgi:hypothetical protein
MCNEQNTVTFLNKESGMLKNIIFLVSDLMLFPWVHTLKTHKETRQNDSKPILIKIGHNISKSKKGLTRNVDGFLKDEKHNRS